MALSSPPTLQAVALEVFWNLRDTARSTYGHTAPSPMTEAKEGVLQIAAFCLLQRCVVYSNVANRSTLAAYLIPLTVIPARRFSTAEGLVKLESSEVLVRSTQNLSPRIHH